MLQSGGKTGCNVTEFGDKRLDKRMETIIEQLSNRPNTSVPQAIKGQHQVKASYRFWDNHKVTPDRILQHQIKETIAVSAEQKFILAVQDTTELDFSTHKSARGLGYLESSKQQGIKVHTALAISSDGLPLGILWQRQWVRPIEEYGKKSERKQKPTKDKESQRWLDCHNEINQSLPEDCTVIHITDREGDIYDLLSAPRSERQHLLLRFAQDRCVEGEEHRIKAALEAQPVSGKFHVNIGRRGLEQPKEVELSVKYLTVKILPPAVRKKDSSVTPITLTAIKAYEENSDEENKIEWYLLTTLDVNSIEDAQLFVKFYSLRWLIERYHYTLKSGCQVESLQLETVERLENAVATYCIIAFRIMYMAYLARIEPEMEARVILTEDEITALRLKYDNNNINGHLTVKTAVIWVARLGGFLARKSDGMPGVKTLWRGLLALEYLVDGYLIARDSFAKLSKNDFSSPLSGYPILMGNG